MKIVIAGAGEVGTHLAKMLSRENHDIVVIEEDREKVQNIEKLYDLIAVQGICTAIQDLKEAGAKDADLFIGVTPIESRNITSCILAHKLGAKKTVARINNYEYLLEENQKFFNDLGIDALIYPELLAAKEITSSIKMNWVRQWMEFSNGALTLIGMKIRANAPILNQKLMDLKNSEFYRVVAIRRNSETIIPKGSDEIKANDIVYFITTKDYIPDVRMQAGKEVIQVKDLMIVGGGNITMKTIESMPDNVDVKVLERDKLKVTNLMEKTDSAMILNVDASDLDVLRDENIAEMDAFVALTDNSEANILACIAAKRFGLKKTIAEIENVDYIQLAESLDIGTVINKKLLAASYIYQYTLDADVHNVKCLTHVDAEVVELTPKEGSPITKGRIMDVKLPNDLFIGGVVRNGVGFIANGQTQIQTGDDVIVFCLSSCFHKLDGLFN
ncbi:MAG: Trk system potassium transporter TrkA [Paludibacteraceae bacterium]|nr:Trk system potassium transporter TrkA [Paludibacteraceae bacterium]MBR5972249.1 Trk system potassium transporter TrkA [Paludibacteraceae bacterium]